VQITGVTAFPGLSGLLEQPAIIRKSGFEPEFAKHLSSRRQRIFAVKPNIKILVLGRIPMEQGIADRWQWGMNEVAGLERNPTRKLSQVSPGADDLPLLELVQVDPR